MALVGAGTAFDATVQIDAKGPVLVQQVAQFIDGLLFPAFDKFTRKAQFCLMLRGRDKGLRMRHRAFDNGGVLKLCPERRDCVFWFLGHF